MLTFLRKEIEFLYFLSLSLVIAGLSTSLFLMSLGTILTVAIWFIEGKFKSKFEKLKANRTALLLLALFALHVIGMVYSSNHEYGLKDLRIKIPLLVFPVILASRGFIEKKWLNRLLYIFIASVLLSTLYSYLIHLNCIEVERDVNDVRTISRFISHIRLSLNICMAILLLLFYFKQNTLLSNLLKSALIIWFLYFLYLIESATGVSIIFVSVLVAFAFYAVNAEKKILRSLSVAALAAFLVVSGLFTYLVVSQYYQPRDLDFSKLEEKTKYGEYYSHDTTNLQLENGYYLWMYVAQVEMEAAWNKRSDFNYEGVDKKGQPIKWTIMRYITSKGFRKDRDGVNSLTEEDIHQIENGIATIATNNPPGLKRRVKLILYEIDSYLRGITPNGNSVTQRFEYWKIGWNLFKSHWLIGVGTGDVDDEYRAQYRKDKSELLLKFRHRAHNQFLTFLITFGIIGFFVFIVSMIGPFIFTPESRNILYILFITIVLVSFLGEDTLETQAGVTFYAFFNSLLLFSRKND